MKNPDKTKAQVTELLPNGTFRLQLEDGQQIIGYLSGKMTKGRVRVLVGDKVDVVMDPYGGKTTNRIVWRI